MSQPKDLAELKELVNSYRQSASEEQRAKLFTAIEEKAGQLNLSAETRDKDKEVAVQNV